MVFCSPPCAYSTPSSKRSDQSRADLFETAVDAQNKCPINQRVDGTGTQEAEVARFLKQCCKSTITGTDVSPLLLYHTVIGTVAQLSAKCGSHFRNGNFDAHSPDLNLSATPQKITIIIFWFVTNVPRNPEANGYEMSTHSQSFIRQ